LEAESKALDAFEQKYWDDYEEFQIDMDRLNEEQNSVKQKIKVTTEQLEQLKRTNVYDDAFHISYDGHFGTINGFRLGRLPTQMVEWSETNAALGQVVCLLATIAKQCNFTFSKHNLIPMGSFSKMAKKDEANNFLELYGSNELFLGKLFWYRRFDQALVWLLYCIREFSEWATTQDPSFKLKYQMKNDMIQDVSIKLQFNTDPKWTKALKFMLTNLKLLLVWVSKRADA